MSEMREISAESGERAVKRKKKRSSMQMAKKYARRSERGHGTELDSDTYQYMVRILEMLRQDFDTHDEKLNFVNNVYEQTIGREIEFAKNQVGSRVLDSLIVYANYDVIKRLSDALDHSLRPLCSDRFASHVVQKIIITCADRGNPSDQNDNSANSEKFVVAENEISLYNEIALKFSRYVINNFEEFVWDTYANHILRTVVECLGGLIEKSDTQNNKYAIPNLEKRRTVVPEYTNLLLNVAIRFIKWPRFSELGKDELTSGTLQSLLRSLKKPEAKLMGTMVKKIITECFIDENEERLSCVFEAESSIRLLEVCLGLAKKKTYSRIYQRFFTGRVGELALMPGANFAVQRLLDACATKEELDEIYDDLSQHMPAILSNRNTGVFASLANACRKLKTRQGFFLNRIMKILGCDKTPEDQLLVVPATATLQNCEKVAESQKQGSSALPINLHGSIIVQAMLHFNKPIKIVNSLLAMRADELVAMFCDPKGSRIVDSYMDSKFIGEKSREKLAKKLQGHWSDLARGVHGSRSLEQIWSWAKDTQRNFIMDELASLGEALRATKSGKIISTKLNVPLYARNKNDWLEAQDKQQRTKALFADIIGESIVKCEENA